MFRKRNFAEKSAYNLGSFIRHAIPFTVGVYLGALEGKGVQASHASKIALGFAPFAINYCSDALAYKLLKCAHDSPGLYLSLSPVEKTELTGYLMEHESFQSNLARGIKASVKTGVLIGAGYGVGRCLAKLV